MEERCHLKSYFKKKLYKSLFFLTHLYIKYSYQIQIIYTLMYGFKYYYLIIIILM